MLPTAAIFYQPTDYDTHGQLLSGRQSASEGFLKAIAQYGTAQNLYAYTRDRSTFEAFTQQVHPWLAKLRQVCWVPTHNFKALAKVGTLYWPDPAISKLSWQRYYRDSQAYSLCGITHTLASKEAMAEIGQLLIAPVQPWDALICTSQTTRTMIEQVLSNWADYLALRMGARPEIKVRLPVIPLGVHCETFLREHEAHEARQRLRHQLGIASEDLVVLFVGRLIFQAKAHPVPMYLALERAAQETNKQVHLIQAGWFEDDQQASAFKADACCFSPSINCMFIDGRQPHIRQGIWSVADIFISLSDNIQETFGLTPIEAMAAGLPVVVSDWNGYQETVRHQVDGFRIPTLMPPAGAGLDFAANYYDGSLNYSTYIGHISMLSAIDIDACVQALIKLFTQPELRRKMGENGRQRAQEVYDWNVIISAYETLWAELADVRASASTVDNVLEQRSHPLCEDPFRLLSHYSTDVLKSDQVLILGSMARLDALKKLRMTWMTSFGANKRAPTSVVDQILDLLAKKEALTVEEILQQFAGEITRHRAYLARTLVHLIKFDVLRVK